MLKRKQNYKIILIYIIYNCRINISLGDIEMDLNERKLLLVCLLVLSIIILHLFVNCGIEQNELGETVVSSLSNELRISTAESYLSHLD